jgi:RNA polymerase sigma-70 factor, ECF subfamily
LTEKKYIPEEKLVWQCKTNSAAAQKQLFAHYAEDMMLLCLRYVPQHEDAREVLMDGFLGFFNGIGSFVYRGEGSAKAWLKKIMVGHCLDFLRKKNPVFIPVTDTHIAGQSEWEGPVDQLSAKEILTMIHALPDGYRMVFNLYVFEGMSHKEIGAELGISESTSKSQLHRARALLKEKILQTN